MRPSLILLQVGLAVALTLPSTMAFAARQVPLGASQVRALYSGKTWVWPKGAGYFSPNGSFRAWSKDSKLGTSHARGRWSVQLGGQLCFTARWFYRTKDVKSQDCFTHRYYRGAILQRKEPDGAWYIFKHKRVRRGDEYLKLRRGNLLPARVRATSALRATW